MRMIVVVTVLYCDKLFRRIGTVEQEGWPRTNDDGNLAS